MQNILHNWSEGDCVKILKNCWKALPNNKKLIIIERVISENIVDAKNTLRLDIIMLTLLGEGKERTENEYKSFTKESGFFMFKIMSNIYGFFVIELYK